MRVSLSAIACALGACGLMLSGCAMHAPMSEMVMFRNKGQAHARPSAPFGAGVSRVQALPVEVARVERAVRVRRGLDPRLIVSPEPTRRVDFSLHASLYERRGRGAISVALGSAMGTDLTLRLVPPLYVTLGTTGDGGQQAIIQAPLLDARRAGAAVGLYGRRELYAYDVTDPSDDTPPSLYNPPSTLPVYHAGARAVITVGPDRTNGPTLYANGHIGYAPALQRPVASFGIALGGF